MRIIPSSRTTATALALAAAFLVSGCGSSGLLNRARPDEFAVQRQTPLVVPPDFSLAPPKPGEPRPNDKSLQDQTLDALFGGPAPRSALEKDAISRAGNALPGIRSMVGDPVTASVAKGELTRQILAAPEGDGRDAQTAL